MYRDNKNCNLGCRLTKRLLGQILVDGEFISSMDLDRAVAEQEHTNELLGEILVRMGAVDPKELSSFLFVQSDFASLKDSVRATAGVRQLLSKLLLQARRITPEQLELALSEEVKTDEKLGEVLVRLGLITDKELDAIVAFQQHQGSEAASERFRLGEILVATNHITREQLEDALVRQKISKKKIGEVLVDAGYLEAHHVEYGLRLQHKLVTAALVAALSLASVPEADEAQAARSGGRDSAELTVTATVLARTSLRMIYQTPELLITNADIRRGYVDAPNASRIEVKSNSQSGYFLVFDGASGPLRPFKGVLVQGLGREVQIDSNGGMVALSDAGMKPVTLELSYRFLLSEDTGPGTYAWPVTVSAIPR